MAKLERIGNHGFESLSIGAHKTTIRIDSCLCTVVEYDGIPVVRFNKGTIWLNHGGRMTPTIRRRMNETSEQFGLGFLVYRNRYRDAICWQVETPSGKVIEWEESNPLAMEIDFPR